jgi:predicted nucleotidyltransferase component of viral defense system
MIIEYLEKIIKNEKQKNSNKLYLRSLIKEYLQILVLEYIYTSDKYKSNLIFTGGTCLRHIYGLERLSEDLDFDFLKDFDTKELAEDIRIYFKSKMKYTDLNISIKQKGKQILLKFPCLKSLDLANESESDFLYIKMDLEKVLGKSFKTEKTSKNIFGSNFVALHYNLPSLFTGKITAILTRNLLEGKENRETIKGRDFYDLLWYLKKDVRVNMEFLQERLMEQISIQDLTKRLNEKVILATTKYSNDFKNDLLPFIKNAEFIQDYVKNYQNEFNRYELSVE